jgi:tetratricopeptide (TPR) repeat protein
MRCPSPTALQEYFEGHSSTDASEQIREHLETCEDCRVVVLALAPTNRQRTPEPPRANPGQLQPGQSIGRYVVINRIGQGGMGVVYLAYDPELDRKVALKLIRGTGDDQAARDLQDLLLREAQAMARITHPNVIAVHDVGRHQDLVFIAMELIDGETLAVWLARQERKLSEIVSVFVSAGHGLMAAHSAGLVHRDFKPNNVMIDRQGRVRVMDFGLARRTQAFSDGQGAQAPLRLPQHHTTASGMLAGTPAYMSPEQLAREATDARTDQFSFCVALYEAACGVRPFVGADDSEDSDALRATILAQELQPPRRTVPRWLLAVTERGMKVAPAERWPSLDELVRELDRDRSRRGRAWALSALGTVALTALGVAMVVRRTVVQPCRGADAKLAGVWDDARSGAVKTAFAAFSSSDSGEQLAALVPTLDRFASTWKAAYVDACEATRVRGEQSAEMLDLRMACLQDRLVETRELVTLLAHPDRPLIARANVAANALDPVSTCAADVLVHAGARLPTDAKARAQAIDIGARIARAIADDKGKHFADGLAIANSAAADATRAKLPSLGAEAQWMAGVIEHHMGRVAEAQSALSSAAAEAQAANDPVVSTRALAQLATLLATQHDFSGAHLALNLAHASLSRLGERPDLDAELCLFEGRVADTEEHLEKAVPLFERSLALATKSGDESAIDEARLSLARAQFRAAHYDLALAMMHANIERFSRQHNTPALTTTYGIMGDTLVALARYDEAIESTRHALAIWKRASGEDNDWYAGLTMKLGFDFSRAQRLDEAVVALKEAIAVGERIDDPTRTVPDAWHVLGGVYNKMHKLAESRDALEHALSHRRARMLANVELASIKWILTRVVWEQGDHALARALAVESAALYAKSSPGEIQGSDKEVEAWRKAHDPSFRAN